MTVFTPRGTPYQQKSNHVDCPRRLSQDRSARLQRDALAALYTLRKRTDRVHKRARVERSIFVVSKTPSFYGCAGAGAATIFDPLVACTEKAKIDG